MRRATRRSSNTVHGCTPELRPRFPSRESSVPLKFSMQGSWNTPVGDAFEVTGVFPSAVHAGLTNVFGRPVSDESCRLSPLAVMMLYGRPDATSIRGANVQLLRNFLPNPGPANLPL